LPDIFSFNDFKNNSEMTDISTIQALVNQRYHGFFLDIKTAQANLLNVDQPTLSVIEIEQSKTTRSLLRVEKQAIREKDLNQKQTINFLKENLNLLNIKIEQRLVEELKNIENIYQKVIGIENAIPELIDLLSVKAATISRIESLASEIPWFYQELLKLANQPKYRRTNSKGKTLLIDSLRVALNMFGIENLNPVVLSLSIRRWLPQITDPYPKIKNRIWEESLATALVSRKLASLYEIDENNAFSVGMLQMMGSIVVVRLYFRLFDLVQREALVEAQNAQLHDQHNAISRLEPSGEFLNQLLDSYALSTSADLIKMMNLKRVFIADAMQELASKEEINEISPLGLALKQARGYARYRLLKMNSLIDVDEAKAFIRELSLPKGALELLKATDIRTLNLVTLNK
jgi:hypothetical protein